jgi:arylsulfatase A-like enzyme
MKRGFLSWASKRVLLLLMLMYAQLPASAQSKPNILIILTDDQGFGEISAYGAKDLQTPNLDALFASGMKITNFYANSPVCSPTRASLLTGKYPDLAGVPGVIRTHADDSWGYLSPNGELLPKVLQKNGYHTSIVGKWHLGLETPNQPNEQGFMHFQGFLGDMMDDYYTHLRHGNNYMRLNSKLISPNGHATDLFTDWASEYIRKQSQSKQPFFLYLAYNAPHDPVQPPQEFLNKVKAREQTITEKRAKLVALIEHLDNGIGKVIQTLKETGAYENTLIIFTSDNGGQMNMEANNGPYREGKGTMYEGGLRVPAAVVWPGKIKPGTATSHLALTMDIYPTIIDALNLKTSKPVDGKSFLPALLNRNISNSERVVYFTRREGGITYSGKTIDAVRKGNWKLLHNTPFSPRELYNLSEDPGEKNNLAHTHTEKLNELNVLMQQHTLEAGSVPWQKINHTK